MTDLDPRLNAYRPDLADAALRGQIDATSYAEGRPGRVAAGRTPLLTRPSNESRMGSELLFGEAVTVFEVRDGWAWLQSQEDGYVGYTHADRLDNAAGASTHRVSALRTFLYAEPDLKSPVRDVLSMNSLLCEREREASFIGLTTGGWVWVNHAAAMDEHESDHAAVALRFLGAPYLWGGRSSIGLDCSGLVQMALARCGKQAPRDSDIQGASLGEAVTFDGDEAALAHGDMLFWPGHVGIWLEGSDFLHANATDMMVARGPFGPIASHIAKVTDSDVIAVRRP
ncbi:MAG: C40 family peptidase [Proteobacteria bacterium]|nr:C40 family peptidase [Pseudomonadota bacterium]